MPSFHEAQDVLLSTHCMSENDEEFLGRLRNIISVIPESGTNLSPPRSATQTLPRLEKAMGSAPVMLDAAGGVLIEPTAFIQHLHEIYKLTTAITYQNIILDFHRCLHVYDNGAGLSINAVSDRFLQEYRWNCECRNVRMAGGQFKIGTELHTIKYRIKIILKYLNFLETRGYASGLIGISDGNEFKINIPTAGVNTHASMIGIVYKKAIPRLPTEKEFELVEAAVLELSKTDFTKDRNTNLIMLLREHPFRRSEVANIQKAEWPDDRKIQTKQAGLLSGEVRDPTIPVKVKRAKKSEFYRHADVSLPIARSVREFLDRSPQTSEGAVFCSRKTQQAITPQSLTNLFTRARAQAVKMAADLADDRINIASIATLRLHHYRHRGITNRFLGLLNHGEDSVKALYRVMEEVGISSIEVAVGYLHYAEDIRSAKSDASLAEKNDRCVAADNRLLMLKSLRKPAR